MLHGLTDTGERNRPVICRVWLLLPDLIGSLMRFLLLKTRYGPSSAFLMNIFFALKGSKLFFILIWFVSLFEEGADLGLFPLRRNCTAIQ